MIRNLDNSELVFPQDERIAFEEAGHIYKLDNGRRLTPVSSVYGRHFKEFDTQYWARLKAKQEGVPPEELMERWECNGTKASHAGTHLHKQIEEYLNGDHEMDNYCLFRWDGKHVHELETIYLGEEIEQFKRFVNEVKFTPFRTEWRVFDEELGIAGTIDLICSKEDGTFELYDWKRSKSLIDDGGHACVDNRFHTRGINGLEHVPDTSYWHYALQQNLYKYIVEKNYGITISAMHLVVLHPHYNCYHVLEVPPCPREISIIVNKWKVLKDN